MNTYDFSRSFLTFRVDLDKQPGISLSRPSPFRVNNARIALESTCTMTHRVTGETRLFALAASCKSELVGVDRDIWTMPNADFCLVADTTEAQLMKSWDRNDKKVMRFPESLGPQPERQVDLVKNIWASFRIDPCAVVGTKLDTARDVVNSVLSNQRINLHMSYEDGDYHIVIQHPVKTINVNEVDNFFQTDTGPIALPDLSDERLSASPRLVSVFDQAYVAFKDEDWAEFIINVPTIVTSDVSVNHYSKPRRIEKMRNVIVQLPQ